MAPGYPQVSPGALYQFQPSQQAMSITGQMRLYEVDEIPSQYKLGSARRRWFTYILSGILAVSVAATVTFIIIRSMRDTAPALGNVYVDSVPEGADVVFDGTRMLDKTPVSIDHNRVGGKHLVRVELAGHLPHEETIEIPRDGSEVQLMARLVPITGKILIDSVPSGAEIRINGEVRGRTPLTLGEVDMNSAKRLELRLKDYQPFVQDLTWPPDGKIQINARLVH
jgi:hypothetical protein